MARVENNEVIMSLAEYSLMLRNTHPAQFEYQTNNIPSPTDLVFTNAFLAKHPAETFTEWAVRYVNYHIGPIPNNVKR